MPSMARIWVLTSGRPGDDKQSLRLAAALGTPFEEKEIVFNDRARTWRLILGPSLSTIDAARSSALEAPWPDLVISSGWRQVPIVRWIKAHSKGHSRLIQMNRPPGARHFDLVLSPPQFQVPDRPNIVRLDWPLQLPPEASKRARAESEWKDRLAPYPHPWTVVLVGGSSHPFDLDRETAQQLFDETANRARRQGGSVMISTSRRTPVAALEALRERVGKAEETALLYEWVPDAHENPYVALLAGGDEFVVTPDSISMLVEVARLGRPLSIAPHTLLPLPLEKRLRAAGKRLLHGDTSSPRSTFREALSDLASAFGLKYGRDLASVSRSMVEQGWAADFPAFDGRSGQRLPDADFDRIVERARGLLERPG
jgi:hypothetical protein